MELFLNITNYIKKKLKGNKKEKKVLQKIKTDLNFFKKNCRRVHILMHTKAKQVRFFEKITDILLLYLNCLKKKIPLVNASLVEYRKMRLSFQNNLIKSRNYFLKESYIENKRIFLQLKKKDLGKRILFFLRVNMKKTKENISIDKNVKKILSDVDIKFCNFIWLLIIIKKMKKKLKKICEELFIEDSISRIIIQYIRIDLLGYNPFVRSFIKHYWYNSIESFQHETNLTSTDKCKILSHAIGSLVIPSLCEIIDFKWDLYINRQNMMLIIEIKIILLHFRNPTYELEKEFIFVQRTLLESIQQSIKKQIINYLKMLPKNNLKNNFNSLNWQLWEMYWLRKIHLIDLIVNVKEILFDTDVVYLTKKLIDDSLLQKMYYFSSLLTITSTSITCIIKCILNVLVRLSVSFEFPIPYIIIHVSLFCQNILTHLKSTKSLEVQLLRIELMTTKLL